MISSSFFTPLCKLFQSKTLKVSDRTEMQLVNILLNRLSVKNVKIGRGQLCSLNLVLNLVLLTPYFVAFLLQRYVCMFRAS